MTHTEPLQGGALETRRHSLWYLWEVQKSRPYLYQYFLNPSVSAGDIRFVAISFIFVAALRIFLCGPRFSPIGSRFKWRPIFTRITSRVIRPHMFQRFSQNLWYFCFHSIAFFWNIYILYLESGTAEIPGWTRLLFGELSPKWYWFPSPLEVARGSEGWPLFFVPQHVRVFYLSSFAFWISCASFLLWEKKKEDFYVMAMHHTVTVTLMVFAYICSYWRVGLIVLVLHDSADIFLYAAKAMHLTTVNQGVVDILFAIFVVLFFLCRLVLFPYFCVYACVNIEPYVALSGEKVDRWEIPGGIALPSVLTLLFLLHVFWFSLVLKVVLRLFSDRPVREGDPRSDSESEETPHT